MGAFSRELIPGNPWGPAGSVAAACGDRLLHAFPAGSWPAPDTLTCVCIRPRAFWVSATFSPRRPLGSHVLANRRQHRQLIAPPPVPGPRAWPPQGFHVKVSEPESVTSQRLARRHAGRGQTSSREQVPLAPSQPPRHRQSVAWAVAPTPARVRAGSPAPSPLSRCQSPHRHGAPLSGCGWDLLGPPEDLEPAFPAHLCGVRAPCSWGLDPLPRGVPPDVATGSGDGFREVVRAGTTRSWDCRPVPWTGQECDRALAHVARWSALALTAEPHAGASGV